MMIAQQSRRTRDVAYEPIFVKSQPCSGGTECLRGLRIAIRLAVGVFHISPSLRKFSRACCAPTP
jgi:hypothetical protein